MSLLTCLDTEEIVLEILGSVCVILQVNGSKVISRIV